MQSFINDTSLKSGFYSYVNPLSILNPLQDSRCKIYIDGRSVYGPTINNPINGAELGSGSTGVVNLINGTSLNATTVALRPTYNATEKAIACNNQGIASTTTLNLGQNIASATVFVYAKITDYTTTPQRVLFIYNNSGATTARFSAIIRPTVGGANKIGIRYNHLDTGTPSEVNTPFSETTGYHLFMFNVNFAGSKARIDIDGKTTSFNISTTTTPNTGNGGSLTYLFNNGINGIIGDVKHVSYWEGTQLTEDEIIKIKNYIKLN
jgi:hypothetical protein